MVSTHLKNISQIGSCPQVGVKIKNVWNHHPVVCFFVFPSRPPSWKVHTWARTPWLQPILKYTPGGMDDLINWKWGFVRSGKNLCESIAPPKKNMLNPKIGGFVDVSPFPFGGIFRFQPLVFGECRPIRWFQAPNLPKKMPPKNGEVKDANGEVKDANIDKWSHMLKITNTKVTLPETNSSPLKKAIPKGNSSSNHPFSGAMLVSGSVTKSL